MTLDHHDEVTAQAMRVVARALIAEAALRHLRDKEPWPLGGLNPYDVSDVMRIVVEYAPMPSVSEIRAALEHLAARTVEP